MQDDRVASAVGLACIHIWGFADERAEAYAESAGIAFQLTNILRDLREDASRGRVYLPQEDLLKFGRDKTQTKQVKLTKEVPVELRYETIVVEDARVRSADSTATNDVVARRSKIAFIWLHPAEYRLADDQCLAVSEM